jgi:hypothetical protein
MILSNLVNTTDATAETVSVLGVEGMSDWQLDVGFGVCWYLAVWGKGKRRQGKTIGAELAISGFYQRAWDYKQTSYSVCW